jgi:hypothetical protein
MNAAAGRLWPRQRIANVSTLILGLSCGSDRAVRGGSDRVRQVLSFLCASALVAAGGYILAMNIINTKGVYLRGLAAALCLVFVGFAWLWGDFIYPLIARHGKNTKSRPEKFTLF